MKLATQITFMFVSVPSNSGCPLPNNNCTCCTHVSRWLYSTCCWSQPPTPRQTYVHVWQGQRQRQMTLTLTLHCTVHIGISSNNAQFLVARIGKIYVRSTSSLLSSWAVGKRQAHDVHKQLPVKDDQLGSRTMDQRPWHMHTKWFIANYCSSFFYCYQ